MEENQTLFLIVCIVAAVAIIALLSQTRFTETIVGHAFAPEVTQSSENNANQVKEATAKSLRIGTGLEKTEIDYEMARIFSS